MFSLADIAAATRGTLIHGDPYATVTGISTDSRTVPSGSLFIALRGERFDGHDFVAAVGQVPHVCVAVEERWARRQAALLSHVAGVITVEDTLCALQDVAIFHRRRLTQPVVGVTGSNGKSTTKELIAAVLGSHLQVMKSPGSFNNHIGVPLSILAIRPEHEAAVVELGMNHAGEIRRLAQIARPQVSVITNVAEAHMGFFNSREEIAAAKCEILEHMSSSEVAVVNADIPELLAACRAFPVRLVTFGEQSADITATEIRTESTGVSFRVSGGMTMRMPLLGRHNVANALAAIAVGRHFGISDDQMSQALARITPLPLRLEPRTVGGRQVVVDCYNANPGSVSAAVEVLAACETTGRRVLVLGDMRELGRHSAAAHERVGALAARHAVDLLITVGDEAARSAAAARAAGMDAARIHSCSSAAEVAAMLVQHTRPGDTVLVKGSRLMRMEETLTMLKTASDIPAAGR